MKNRVVVALSAGMALSAGAASVSASVVTSSPNLPPNVGAYYGVPSAISTYHPAGVTLELKNVVHTPGPVMNIFPDGLDEQETYFSLMAGDLSVNGGPFTPTNANGLTTTKVFGKIGHVTGTFNTEMLALNLSGGDLPPGVMMRESPTLASTGQTSITSLPGGLFQIDSFFDVFTELSIDGGQTWVPDTTGPYHITLLPAPSAAALLGLGGLMATRRRRSR